MAKNPTVIFFLGRSLEFIYNQTRQLFGKRTLDIFVVVRDNEELEIPSALIAVGAVKKTAKEAVDWLDHVAPFGIDADEVYLVANGGTTEQSVPLMFVAARARAKVLDIQRDGARRFVGKARWDKIEKITCLECRGQGFTGTLDIPRSHEHAPETCPACGGASPYWHPEPTTA